MLVVKELSPSEFIADNKLTLSSKATKPTFSNSKLKDERIEDLKLKLAAYKLGEGKNCNSAKTQKLCQDLLRFCQWKPKFGADKQISLDHVGTNGDCVPVRSFHSVNIIVPHTYKHTFIKTIQVGERVYKLQKWLTTTHYYKEAEWERVESDGVIIFDGVVLEADDGTRLIPTFEMQNVLLCFLSDKCVVLRHNRNDLKSYDIIYIRPDVGKFIQTFSSQEILEVSEIRRTDDTFKVEHHATGKAWVVNKDSLSHDLMYISLRLLGFSSKIKEMSSQDYVESVFTLPQLRENASIALSNSEPL